MKKIVFQIAIFSGVITSIIFILGYFGMSDWRFDLLSHFRVQYLIVYLGVTFLLLLTKWRSAIFFTPFIFLLIWEISPFYFPEKPKIEAPEKIKIVSINLLSSNSEFDLVIAYIRTKNPDIIVLEEFNDLWDVILKNELEAFPYKISIPRSDNFGIAVYSKIKFDTLQEVRLATSGAPSVIGTITLDGKKLSILATHPLPPVDQWYFDNRNSQLSAIADYLKKMDGQKIVVGDLNTSSFSIFFKNLLKESNLIDSRIGFGLQPTWPTWFPPAFTTLDHVLISEGVVVLKREVGDYIGSDHLPVYLEFDLK